MACPSPKTCCREANRRSSPSHWSTYLRCPLPVSFVEFINSLRIYCCIVAFKEALQLFQELSDAERRLFHKLSPNIQTAILLFMSDVESVETRYVSGIFMLCVSFHGNTDGGSLDGGQKYFVFFFVNQLKNHSLVPRAYHGNWRPSRTYHEAHDPRCQHVQHACRCSRSLNLYWNNAVRVFP